MNKKEFGDLCLLAISDLKSIDIFNLKLENGKFVPLYGPNGSGKSTVMDSLMMLFNGGQIPEGTIRSGKEEAKIEVETTEGYRIQKRIRKIKSGKDAGKETTELVMTKNNQKIPGPQKVLKDLFAGFLTPNKIADARGADLYKKVVRAAGISPDQYDSKIEQAKSYLKEVKIQNGIYEGMAVQPTEPEPERVIKYDPVKHNKLIGQIDKLERAPSVYAEQLALSEEMHDQIVQLEKQLEAAKSAYNQKLIQLDEIKNIAKFEAELPALRAKLKEQEDAQNSGEIMQKWAMYKENKKKADEYKSTLYEAKNKVNKLIAERKAYIEQSDTGVSGLSLTEDGLVKYKGIVWDNVCFSDRMKVSALLTLENLPEDKLPIMFIEHGESLSKDKREEIAKTAIDKGAQVFMEVFTEDTTGCKDGVIMRISESEPIIPEDNIPHHEVIDAVVEQAKDFTKQKFDPSSVDLTGDISMYSPEQLEQAVKAQMDEKPIKTPEELGMKKAADLPVERPIVKSEPPDFDFGFGLIEETKEEVKPDEPVEEPESDDPWANLDIF